MTMLRRFLAPATALVLSSVLTACGGDSGSNSSNTNDVTGSGASAAGTLREINLAQSVQTIQQLKSFKFDLSLKMDLGGTTTATGDPLGDAFIGAFLGLLTDVKASGAFVGPDSIQATVKLAGQEVSVIQIADKAWVKDGGAWRATAADSFLMGMSPEDLFTEFMPDEVLKGAKVTQEKVNGVDATRYSYDKATLEKLALDMGEAAELEDLQRANLDVWLNKDNVPVKVVMDFAGKNEKGNTMGLKLELNVTNINDTSVQIKPPA
jgi:hypothetical protein